MIAVEERRNLPIFIHSVVDDMTDVTPNAMRVYMHLARRSGKSGYAYPSYQSIGDHCFSSVSGNPTTRRSMARKAIDELICHNLIAKQQRSTQEGDSDSNAYVLLDVESTGRGVPIGTHEHVEGGGVPNKHTGVPIGTKGTPFEGTPFEELDNTVATANAVTTSLPAAPTNVGAANHRPPPKQPPPTPKATATEPPSKEPNPTQAILAAYVEVRGKNGINYGKEGAAAKKIAKDGFGPEQVQDCYRWLKGQKFWADKPLSLHTIFEYLPEHQRVRKKEEQDRPYDWNKVSNLPILNKVEMSIEEITF